MKKLLKSLGLSDFFFLGMISAPEEYEQTYNRFYDNGKYRSLNAESDIVEQAVGCFRSIKLKNRERNDHSAVRQTEDDILREVPCRVCCKSAPKAVKVINHQRELQAAQENVDKRDDADAGISCVKQAEKQ